jgi:hypothetical protein
MLLQDRVSWEIMAGQCLAGAMLKTPRDAGIAIERRVRGHRALRILAQIRICKIKK